MLRKKSSVKSFFFIPIDSCVTVSEGSCVFLCVCFFFAIKYESIIPIGKL